MLNVAGGILLAFLVIGIVRAIYMRMAVQQVADQMQEVTNEIASSSRRYQAEQARQEDLRLAAAAQQRTVEAQASALPAGHRCIGKDLFRRVDNGWVQITDGTAKRICHS